MERDAVMGLAYTFFREAPPEVDDGAGNVEIAAGVKFRVGEVDDSIPHFLQLS